MWESVAGLIGRLEHAFPKVARRPVAELRTERDWFRLGAQMALAEHSLRLAYDFALEAQQHAAQGRAITAMLRLAESEYWHGVMRGAQGMSVKVIRASHSQAMLVRRHEENHNSRADVETWCAEHRTEYKTQTAAIDAAIKLVPMKRSTLKTWIAAFDKRVR